MSSKRFKTMNKNNFKHPNQNKNFFNQKSKNNSKGSFFKYPNTKNMKINEEKTNSMNSFNKNIPFSVPPNGNVFNNCYFNFYKK